MLFIFYAILIVQCASGINAKWAVDVDSSIVDEIQSNPSTGYLIKFHAPWCGHCRHFEPVYEEIAKEVNELSATVDEFKNIRIVRIDATIYSDAANHYDIRGFPTVKFIRGSQIISYENERTKSAVLKFLKRVNGPSLRWISSVDKFNEIRNEHDVFFLLVTTTMVSEDDQLVKEYNNIINRYLSQAYFYATNESIVQETFFSNYKSDDESQIFAVKNEGVYLYKPDDYNNSIEDFIVKEKVATFPQVAAGNMYDLVLTKKIIVIYGFDESPEATSSNQKNSELKSRIHNYLINHIPVIHQTFQFAWSNDLDLLSNIAVWAVEGPLLFLYDSVQRKYGMHPLSSTDGKTIDVESILDYVLLNHTQIISQTGNTLAKRLFRPFWELSRTLMAMFTESPFLSMLIIGLPASVLSIVCYCLCCLPNETMNDPDYSYEIITDDQNIGQNEEEDDDDASSPPVTPDDNQKAVTDKKDD
ncbi:unnamed protein product [Rotaria socialis]|uniref:Thioredoxin domain-containing protein n=2 Tax=Rotaria socialis TaxID=392032 RepID=A0A817YBR9_9BILA|nr:unnamed protein product [Rotaria socialis]CAF3372526.1 unnamed protein product [Rotaria socialis]CAF3378351.1 unnamed protein product [Rotaria socialis]CAF3398536.1 unnamed protein product [Rotaria socialis]CAF3475979.1 unnamed protein product [Rotaria socialis]